MRKANARSRTRSRTRSRSASREVEDGLPLRIDSRPAVRVQGAVVVAEGDKVDTEFVLDDGADVNVVSQTYVVQHGLVRVASAELPSVGGFLSDKGRCYGAHRIKVCLTDSQGCEKQTTGLFYAFDMPGAPILLGRPWRHQQAVKVDASTDSWEYGVASQAVRVLTARDFYRIMKGEERVFAVHTTDVEELELPIEIQDFKDVFNPEKDVTKLKRTDGVEHAINLEPSTRPPFRPLYNLSISELKELREYLDLALRHGWIRRSTSEAGAPIIFVPKKDGSLRLCVDYRGLNEISMKDRCPLPLISETLDRLSRAAWFSKMDLRDAYHRIPIKKGDEWKTAFRTRYGHFEYLVMPFGLTNAPATFQAYINRALAGLFDVCCVVYLDDILIYSNTREQHAEHLRLVLERLRKYALYASLKKCEFFTHELEFLGFVVSAAGVTMDRRKVHAIETWPTPMTLKETQSFLGFANFYRRFIRHYSKIAAPLTALTKGNKDSNAAVPFKWTAEAEEAFCMLRDAFTSAPILKHYDPVLPIKMETDASGFAAAGILLQLFAGEKTAIWHPIAYWSRKLSPAEVNYETHDQELLAIVESFKQWRHYLEGAQHTIRVLSDHNNLRGFMSMKQLNGRQARWATYLARFDFVIEHNKGVNNPADGPSRRADYAGGTQAATNLLPTLQKKLTYWKDAPGNDEPVVGRVQAECAVRAIQLQKEDETAVHAERVALPAFVARAVTTNDSPPTDPPVLLTSLLRQMQANEELPPSVGTEKWSKKDGLWYFQDRLYVPSDEALRTQLLRMHHDSFLAGHFGRDKTLALISRKYFWNSIERDVKDYVQTCEICQKSKARRHRVYGETTALPLPNRPWQEITMDFITDLPPSKREGCVYDAILVVVCRFSKMCLYVPTNKTCTSVELGRIVIDEVIRRFGVPDGIVSDRGSVFTSAYWEEFCVEAQVSRKLSTAFHPQTDGQTKRQNQTLE